MNKYIDKQNPPIKPEDLKRLHYLCGLTLCATQRFEYGLKYLLFLLSSHGKISLSIEDAENIMEGRKKKKSNIAMIIKFIVPFDITKGLSND